MGILQQFLAEQNPQLAQLLEPQPEYQPGRFLMSLVENQAPAATAGRVGGAPLAGGSIDELLWRTDDHFDHLHFGSDDAPIKRIARILERKGFDISGLEGFQGQGPINSGHVENSMHYSGDAFDANYNGAGRWKGEPQALDWLEGWLQRRFG